MVRFNIKEFQHKNIIIISSELQSSVAYIVQRQDLSSDQNMKLLTSLKFRQDSCCCSEI